MSSSPPTLFPTVKATATILLDLGANGAVRSFARAARELKAAAILALFALASLFLQQGGVAPAPAARPGKGGAIPASGRSAKPSPEAWRNPSVTAYDPEPAARPLSPPPLRGVSPSFCAAQCEAKALATLNAILALCADPERYARRLTARLRARPVSLTAVEARAFGVHARGQARKNREAAALIAADWRGRRARRRRRDSG